MFTHHQTEKTDSLDILPVTLLFAEGDELLLKCPHCGSTRGIENDFNGLNNVKGEQYQDNLCDGWYEISFDAKLAKNISEIESQPCLFEQESNY